MVTYYQVLGVKKDASQDEIKQAYRERMKAHHSDLHGQSDDPIVRLITEAYRVLGSPSERSQYDEKLRRNGESPSTDIAGTQSATVTPQPQTRTRELCKECKGYGYNPILGVRSPCRYCNGEGWVPGKIGL